MIELLALFQPSDPPVPPDLTAETCRNPLYRFDNPAECAADTVLEAAGSAVGSAAGSAFEKLAHSVGEAAADLFTNAMTWWVTRPTYIDPTAPAVTTLQSYVQPVAILILMVSVLAQAIRMILSRKKDPAIDVGIGLVRYAVITAMALIVLGAAMSAADGISRSILAQAIPAFTERMAGVFAFLGTTQPFILFLIGLVVVALSLVQWIIAFLRQAAILVLATMIPLAASGSVNRSTRPWMTKLAGWLIALVAYKPMAAMIYAIGFQLMGQAEDLSTAVTGVMVLFLAVFALPAMLRFFQWAPASAGGGSGGGGVLAAGALGAISLSQIAGGGSANRQADTMDRSGPQTAPNGAATAPAGGQRALPASGAAPSGAAAGGATAAGGGGGAAAAGGGAAAAGPAGVAVLGAVEARNAIRRAPGAVADKMTGEA